MCYVCIHLCNYLLITYIKHREPVKAVCRKHPGPSRPLWPQVAGWSLSGVWVAESRSLRVGYGRTG